MIGGSAKRLMLLSLAGTAALACLPGLASDAGTGGDRDTHAFVLTNLFLVSSGDAGTCEALSEGGLDVFARSLTESERAEYASPDKRPALARLMAQRLGFRTVVVEGQRGGWPQAQLPPGFDKSAPMTRERALEVAAYNDFPAGRGYPTWHGSQIDYDSCTDPEDFPQLAQGGQIYSGEVAHGSDLDGRTGPGSFVGIDGAPGVDNQLWRAVGCEKMFREEGDEKEGRETMLSSQAPTVVVVKNASDLRNDSDVTVEIYAVREPIVRDGRNQALAGATYTPVADPTLHATVRGRIVDGVLTTDPVDITTQFKEQILDTRRVFRGARIRLVFKEDRTVEGSLDGYYTLSSFWDYMAQRTQTSANVTGYSCPTVHQAVNRMADGYRDPQSGRFTAISSSFKFVGVRAFLVAGSPGAAAGEVGL